MEPQFFASAEDFRLWLAANHDQADELWVGFYKKGTKLPSITWPESVDQALCYGWIDGLRRSIDDQSYKIRFTPRKPSSHWSEVNIRKMDQLREAGLMTASGEAAFMRRKEKNSGRASYEQEKVSLSPEYEARLKGRPEAWAFFQSIPSSKRKQSIWWVMSAKRAETRERRLQVLMACSAVGKLVPPFQVARSSK